MKTPAERLKEVRILRGYAGPSEVAKRFEWPLEAYKSAENGHRGLSKNNARRYARGLGTTAGWLLYGEGPGPKGTAAVPADGLDGRVLELSITLALSLRPNAPSSEIARAARILYRLLVSRELPDDAAAAEIAARAMLDDLMRREDV
jgi:hypothetical protein